jgi:hypothetical protein
MWSILALFIVGDSIASVRNLSKSISADHRKKEM